MFDVADILLASREAAERLGFPPFVGPERESTPLNATPFVAHINEAGEGGFLSNRTPFIRQLRVALERLRASHAVPIAALLGGSAIGPKLAPSDLDCVVFYEEKKGQKLRPNHIAKLQKEMKQCNLDVRFIPADGDPVLFIKTVSFFSTLYCKNAGDLSIVRGLVLLDCRNDYDRPPKR